MFCRKEKNRKNGHAQIAQRIRMTSRRQSDDDENYFSDPVKLVHTSEDRTFITDGRFIDAEIIDLGDILSPDEDAEYDPPKKTEEPMPTQVEPPDSCKNILLNPSTNSVDFCERPSKNERLTRHSDDKELENMPMKLKHQEQNSKDSEADSDIEFIDQIDSSESINKVKTNNPTCLNNEMVIQKAIDQGNLIKIDIKKNTGLVGMKIKRSHADFNKSLETNSKKKIKHTIEKPSKKSRNIHKVKIKTNLIKEKEKVTFKSKPTENITERIKKNNHLFLRKHTKQNLSKKIDIFDKEKQIDSDVRCPMIKSTFSPKACRDVEKSLVKKVCENDIKIKGKLKENMSVFMIPAEDKEHNEISFKHKSILEKYTNSKDPKRGSEVMTQKNLKENDINDDTEQTTIFKVAAGQSNPKTTSIAEQKSFPKLNKYTKKILKNIQKAGNISPKTNFVKVNKKEKPIKSNMNLDIKVNDILPSKETFQNESIDQNSDNTKKSNTYAKSNDGRKNIKTDLAPTLPHSQKQNAKLKSPLRSNDQLMANKWKIQPANKAKDIVVKLPFPFPSISNNISSIDPKTNAQLQHNILNINNTKETQNEKILIQPLGRIEEQQASQQPIPEGLYSLPFGNAKTLPTRFNRNILRKVHYVHPNFPDPRMKKKSPKPPYNMNMYRPPPPDAFTPFFYPVVMPTIPDNSGVYTANNQNYGCRVGSYMLPYGTEIFPYPPPQPPPPPPPPPPLPPLPQTLPPDSQQQLHQIVPYTNQMSTQNSIIGRNSDGIIKKINIASPTSTNLDEIDDRISKISNITNNAQQNIKNVNEAVAITPIAKKSEMLKELDTVIQSGNITVCSYSFKNNPKRPLTSKLSIRDKNKNNKPCPLSKKVKVSDPRTLPSKVKINEEPEKKGYSPPILPIPTFDNIFSQIDASYIRSVPDTIVEKPTNKNTAFTLRHDHHTEVKKISLEEYKKKSSVASIKTKENKYRRLDALVKNLCQK